jgi:hypothetical protein
LGPAIAGPLLLLLAGGCQSLASGPARDAPNAYNASIFQLDPAKAVLQQDWSKYTTDSERKSARNDFITARMYVIDQAYYEFEQIMLQESRTGGFLGDFIIGALTSGAAIIDDREIQRAFSTGAATLVHGRQAFDKQVLLERTIQTLQNQMRANRAEVKTRILQRLSLPYDQWPIGLAQSDAEDYYQAGTIVSALTAASDSASDRKEEKEDDAEVALTSAYRSDALTDVLRNYITGATGEEKTRRVLLGKRLLDAQRVALGRPLVPFSDFVISASPEDQRKLIEALHAAETGEAKAAFEAALKGQAPPTPAATPPANPAALADSVTAVFNSDAIYDALRVYITGPTDPEERRKRVARAQLLLDTQRTAQSLDKVPFSDFVLTATPEDRLKLLKSLRDAETGEAKAELEAALNALNQGG